MDLIWLLLYPRPQYSTKMIIAVLDVSLIMGFNVGETDKVFYINNNEGPKSIATESYGSDVGRTLST